MDDLHAIKPGYKKVRDEFNEILPQLGNSNLNIIGILKKCQNSMTYLAVT